MVHCGAVRQTASIINMSEEHVRTGDRTSVTLRFIKHPEYLKIGAKIIFREGRTKAVGTVTAIHASSHPYAVPSGNLASIFCILMCFERMTVSWLT